MSKVPMNPLQGLLQKASKTLPVETGAVAVHQERLQRRQGAIVLLADVSASMGAGIETGQRKIDVLRTAVRPALERSAGRLLAFSRTAREVTEIPEPEANTDLTAGLELARSFDPGTTLVISDGQPDDPNSALDLARRFRGVIDVLYIGPEHDRVAIRFMQRLAQAAGGTATINDIATAAGAARLPHHLTTLLSGPRHG